MRYKQTLLGVVWAVLQPLMYMVVFTLFFGRFLDVYAVGPYPLLALSGSVIWLFFANSVTLASGSLVGNASLFTKVYFPRLLAPSAPVLAGARRPRARHARAARGDGRLRRVPGAAARFGGDPVRARSRWATAAGVGAWLAALNVKYRDIRFVVPFLLQLWLFASAVVHLVRRARPRRAVARLSSG